MSDFDDRGPEGNHGGNRLPRGTRSPHEGGSVRINLPITVKSLAEALGVRESDLLKVAFREFGFGAVNLRSLIDLPTAELLAHEFQVEIEVVE